MKSALRSVLLSCIIVAGGAQPASAVPYVIEMQTGPDTVGFAVVNDSNLYIWKYWVTNPGAEYNTPSTTRPGWSATSVDLCVGLIACFLTDRYAAQYSSDTVSGNPPADTPTNEGGSITPGTLPGGCSLDPSGTISCTGFVPGDTIDVTLHSTAHVYFLGGTEADVDVVIGTILATATPAPAALPLMGSVLGAGWLVARWRRRRAAERPQRRQLTASLFT